MVRPTTLAVGPAYYCEICLLAYRERAWAERCEEHCRKFPSCSLEVARHAIGSVEATEN